MKATYIDWHEDQASRLAASLAFYTILSLSPFLIVVLAIAKLFYGKAAAQGELVNEIRNMVGDQGAQAIQTIIINTSQPKSGIIATILGVSPYTLEPQGGWRIE